MSRKKRAPWTTSKPADHLTAQLRPMPELSPRVLPASSELLPARHNFTGYDIRPARIAEAVLQDGSPWPFHRDLAESLRNIYNVVPRASYRAAQGLAGFFYEGVFATHTCPSHSPLPSASRHPIKGRCRVESSLLVLRS